MKLLWFHIFLIIQKKIIINFASGKMFLIIFLWKNREKVEKTSIAFKKYRIYNRVRGEMNEDIYLSRRKITKKRVKR